MRLPSASKLDLAAICLFPWTSGLRWPRDVSSSQAEYGRALHRVAELAVGLVLVLSKAYGLALDDTWLLAYAWLEYGHGIEGAALRSFRAAAAELRANVAELGSEEVYAEVALFFDLVAGSARFTTIEAIRDYKQRGKNEIALIIDLIYFDDAGRPHVRDWKTGKGATETDARDSAQLRLCGLAAARAFGWRDLVIEFGHVSADGIELDAAELSAFDLDVMAGELLEMRQRMEEPARPSPGTHCRSMYCPIVAECPITKTALASVYAGPMGLPMSAEIISAEHLVSVRQRRKMVEAALETIKHAEHAWVLKNGPVEVAPGILYGARQHDGREQIDLDVPGALTALRAELGEHTDTALEITSSKAAIGRAAAKAAPKGQKAALERKVMGKLRELGALKSGAPYVVYEEFQKEKAG